MGNPSNELQFRYNAYRGTMHIFGVQFRGESGRHFYPSFSFYIKPFVNRHSWLGMLPCYARGRGFISRPRLPRFDGDEMREPRWSKLIWSPALYTECLPGPGTPQSLMHGGSHFTNRFIGKNLLEFRSFC